MTTDSKDIAEHIASSIIAEWENETPTKAQMELDIKLSIGMVLATQQTQLLDRVLAALPPKVEQTQPSFLTSSPWPPLQEVEAANAMLDRVKLVLQSLKAELGEA